MNCQYNVLLVLTAPSLFTVSSIERSSVYISTGEALRVIVDKRYHSTYIGVVQSPTSSVSVGMVRL
jgi:hypothetical protein